jgi:hypothetical protein
VGGSWFKKPENHPISKVDLPGRSNKSRLPPPYGRFWDFLSGSDPSISFRKPDFQALFGRSAAAKPNGTNRRQKR